MNNEITNKEILGYYRQYVDGITWENKEYPEHVHKEPVPFIDWVYGFCKKYQFIKEPEHIKFCVSNGNCGAQDRVIYNLALCQNNIVANDCSCLREV